MVAGVIREEPDGGFWGQVSALPRCYSQGERVVPLPSVPGIRCRFIGGQALARKPHRTGTPAYLSVRLPTTGLIGPGFAMMPEGGIPCAHRPPNSSPFCRLRSRLRSLFRASIGRLCGLIIL